MEQKASHLCSIWSWVNGAQWQCRVRIAVLASGGQSIMRFQQGSLMFVKIKLMMAVPMHGWEWLICFGQRSRKWHLHDDMLQTVPRLSMKALNCQCLEGKSVGLLSFWRFAVLAYLRSILVRSSIGGLVKLVLVDHVRAFGEAKGTWGGSSLLLSWLLSVSLLLKNVSWIGGYANIVWFSWPVVGCELWSLVNGSLGSATGGGVLGTFLEADGWFCSCVSNGGVLVLKFVRLRVKCAEEDLLIFVSDCFVEKCQ